MKKTFRIAGIILLVAMVFGCVTAPQRDPNAEYTLTILHTNDHHGAVLAKDGEAGLAERATFVKGVRAEKENVLVLDAGDINTGSAISNMFGGELDINAYNLMGYDAVALGNHEFDGTHEKLAIQVGMSEFDWLSANIMVGSEYFVEPYIIKDYEGFRVGVFGLTTNRTQVIASPSEHLGFVNEIEVAEKMVDMLRSKEKVDIVIALGHLGTVKESETFITSNDVIAAVDGIDIFIDGHSHTYFEKAVEENGTILVSANEWGKVMGKMDLTIKDGKIIRYDWMPVAITTESFPPDAEMAAFIKPYADKANESLQDVVMVTSEMFDAGDKLSRKKETALGDLVSDAQVAYLASTGVTVDFGFTNGGNIRASLPEGNVTKEDILTMLPFENYVYVLDLKGSDVVALFDFIGSIPQGAGGWAQMSKEVSYTITYAGEKGSISNLLIGGSPVDPNRTYKIAVNNYLAGGGDAYEALTKAVASYNTSMLMSDIVIWYAETLPQPIAPAVDGRITVVGGVILE